MRTIGGLGFIVMWLYVLHALIAAGMVLPAMFAAVLLTVVAATAAALAT